MEIRIIDDSEKERFGAEIYEILKEADNEFLPPLSQRSSTTQSDLKPSSENDGVMKYFNEMINQRIMVALEDGQILAFVSFRENYKNSEITDTELPNIYISTLIVKPEGRGKRLTQIMYEMLFKEYETVNIFTRTWSLNAAHIKILSKFDFKEYKVLKNDRGEGVDTVYFIKKPVYPGGEIL